MAYRKTEKVLAQLEAKRNSFIAAAIDVIAKSGMEGLTTDAVAARAGVADGLLYSYFPDKTELLAAVVAHVLARDLAAMKEAIEGNSSPERALENGISLLFTRASASYRVMAVISQMPIYREGMRRELARLIRAAGAEGAPVLASATYGAIFETAAMGSRVGPALTASLLRALGAPVRATA